MGPFSPEHMELIRPLPTEQAELRRALDRWFTVAWDKLETWTARRLGRHRWSETDREEAFTEALFALHQKIRHGKFEESPDRSEVARFATAWRRLLIDWERSTNRSRRGHVDIANEDGDRLETLAHSEGSERDTEGETAEEQLLQHEETASAEERSDALEHWRDWPIPVNALVTVACEACPDDVKFADVERACSASRVESRAGKRRVLGWSRAVDETWRLLEPWLKDYARWREEGNLTTTPEQAARLAFVLRGPPGLFDLEVWPQQELTPALDWLYQQRHRTKKRLTARLGIRREGGA